MPRKNPHAVSLGRKGGSVSSPKKAAAARRNGRKLKATLCTRCTCQHAKSRHRPYIPRECKDCGCPKLTV